MIKGYRKADPPVKHQAAVPPRVYRMLHLSKGKGAKRNAVAWNLTGAVFYALRSCEYTETPGEADKFTEVLRVKDITFMKQNRTLHHTDPYLHLADTVHAKFPSQKNLEKDEVTTCHNNGDPTLNPTVGWAMVVRRVMAIPGATTEWTVDKYQDEKGKIKRIKGADVEAALRAMVGIIGEDELGILEKDVGTHTNRSSAAMWMYLNGVRTFTIMLQGRWGSDAFLTYIRKQVREFSSGVSHQMIQHDTFYNVVVDEERDDEDPAFRGDRNNFANNGSNTGATFLAPRIHVWE